MEQDYSFAVKNNKLGIHWQCVQTLAEHVTLVNMPINVDINGIEATLRA